MSREAVTVTFDDSSQRVYQNVPDDVTPEQIEMRARVESGGRKVINIDGGTKGPEVKEPSLGSKLWGAFKEGLSTPKHSIIKAPGQIGEAVSGVAYGTGQKVTDALTSAGASPEVAAAGGTAANVGVETIPMLIGGNVGSKAAPLMEKGARWAMQSALKPDKLARESGEAGRVVQTLLDEGINVTEGGVVKLRGQIDDINKAVKAKLEGNYGQVEPAEVTKRLDELTQKTLNQVNPNSDVAAIQKALDEFVNHPLIRGSVPISTQTAQALKTGTYRSLGNKAYGELKGADIEAQKALARGLREEIAKQVPGIEKLNAKEAQLLEAEILTQSRVVADQNKNLGGLAWLASHPVEAIGMILDRSPLAKSLLARAMYASKERLPASLGQAVGAGVGAASGTPPRE